MTKTKSVVFSMILLFLIPILADADIVHLKNGGKIEAEETWEENGMIKIRSDGMVVGYPLESVARVETSTPSYSEASDEAETAPMEMERNAPRKVFQPTPEEDARREKKPDSEAEKFVKRNFLVQWLGDGYNSLKKIFDPSRHGNPMTISELIGLIERINFFFLLLLCMIPPVTVFIVSRLQDRAKVWQAPWKKYVYSFFVYAVAIPGIMSVVLTAYAVFFLNRNLLDLNIFIYFMPIFVMIVTLIMIGKVESWKHLPGVDRIQGLIVFLLVSFLITLAIQRTRIFIFFGGSFISLIIIAVICFVILKVSMNKMFGRKTNLDDLL